MRVQYKRSLTFIAILIAICGIIGIAYLFYDKVLSNDTIVIVDNELSTNYMNGYKISTNGEYKFSVTNNGDKDIYYNVLINNIKGIDNNLKYSIISSDSNISIQNKSIDTNTDILLNSVLIKSKETQNFTLIIENNTSSIFDLSVKKTNDNEEYFYATILKNNKVLDNSFTKAGESIAIDSEGLIEDVDDAGVTYYFRGNVLNNYVLLGSNLWRIVRINGDGTVKLILNGVASDPANYHSTLKDAENFEESNISKALTTYYETTLMEYDSIISNSKFCIENGKNEANVYNSYTRLVTNKIPTFNCLGENYSSKIGLITPDEVLYAGGSLNLDNTNYYLYNSKIDNYWWTIDIARITNNDFYPFAVSKEGKLVHSITGITTRGLRPVININKKVMVTGDGTENNPYVIVHNNE